ncbi:hypothetical protein [Flavobacterium sp.]|uniref:hypothetical protein n=1 Tax=Flavobacterium sp. TaxID=239 RepID=UPI0039E652C2
MKNVVLSTVLLLNLACFAQVEKPKMEERKAKMEKLESFTPEQQAELQLKKMTLDLSLDTKQQEQLKKVLLNQAKKRETTRNEIKSRKEKGEKLSKDERFDMQSKMLDEKLALKEEMKKILTADQFKKWEENIEKREERKEKFMSKKQNAKNKQ